MLNKAVNNILFIRVCLSGIIDSNPTTKLICFRDIHHTKFTDKPTIFQLKKSMPHLSLLFGIIPVALHIIPFHSQGDFVISTNICNFAVTKTTYL